MILARPANLQRVPSPLAYVGRRGGVPFVPELAAHRFALASIAYLPGVSSSRAENIAAGLGATAPVRRTQSGFPRVTQSGALRILPMIYQAAAVATPAEPASQRLACVSVTYAGLPLASALESGAQRLAATATGYQVAASASPIESVTVRTAATATLYQAAAQSATARTARQRLACIAATYAAA